jgi:hypothetical protein
MFGELEQEKEKMIKIARKCFETANNVNLNKKRYSIVYFFYKLWY